MKGGYKVRWCASRWYLANVDPESAPTIEIGAADAAEAEDVAAELLAAFPGEPVGDGTDCLIEVVGPGGDRRVMPVPS